MTGYSHTDGMSNRAVDAYSRGVKPLSKITARDLRDAGWTETLKLARFLAKWGFWARSEWHHSGGTWYNEIDFYDPEALVAAWNDLTEDEREAWRNRKMDAQSEGARVEGTYAIFAGTRSRTRYAGEQPFTGTLVGNWIHLDEGGKKRANGNHIKYTKSRKSFG